MAFRLSGQSRDKWPVFSQLKHDMTDSSGQSLEKCPDFLQLKQLVPAAWLLTNPDDLFPKSSVSLLYDESLDDLKIGRKNLSDLIQ